MFTLRWELIEPTITASLTDCVKPLEKKTIWGWHHSLMVPAPHIQVKANDAFNPCERHNPQSRTAVGPPTHR